MVDMTKKYPLSMSGEWVGGVLRWVMMRDLSSNYGICCNNDLADHEM